MGLHRRNFMTVGAGVLALPLGGGLARAQSYPARAVRVVVPFAPGGPTDIFARIIAQELSERFGKQFYVDNVAGATGNIGTAQVAKAAPDGHTLLVCVTNLVTNPLMFSTVQYDPFKDFEPISLPVISDIALVVHPSVAATTVAELVSEIRAGKSKFSYASGGVGSITHLMGEHQWVGVLAPAGTPKEIVTLLNREIQAAMALSETKERFAVLGYEVVGGAPEDLTAQIRTDMEIWGKVIRTGNLKPG